MSLPRAWMGGVLVYWGWETGLVWMALPLALALEGAGLVSRRWDLEFREFNRVVDVVTLLLAMVFLISLTTAPEKGLSLVMQWLPPVFAPLMAAQVYSTAGKIPVRSFFLSARKQKMVYTTHAVDMGPVFGVLCLCGAGAGHPGNPWFFPWCFGFSAWALWAARPGRYPVAIWGLALLAAAVLGYSGQKGYYAVRMTIYRYLVDYYADHWSPNPFKTATAMGDIGEIKLSGRILFRVLFDPGPDTGETYLHGATYDRFGFNTWFASSPFVLVPGQGSDWQVAPGPRPEKAMTFYLSPKKEDLLWLPAGTVRLEGLAAEKVEKNGFSAVRISRTPALAVGTAWYGNDYLPEAGPTAQDLMVPAREAGAVRALARHLGIDSGDPWAAVQKLSAYFQDQFTYSLKMAGPGRATSPLHHFLTHTRQGHCELFATATALTLRAAGIPARYAVGFIAHEYSRLSGMTVVRQQDAHAWVKAWINGQWVRVDTTPPGFIRLDRNALGSTLVRDLFSALGFWLSRFRHQTGPGLVDAYGLWLVLPLVLILAFRLRGTPRVGRTRAGPGPGRKRPDKREAQGMEKVEAGLARLGFGRFSHETRQIWYCRIQEGIRPLNIHDPLTALIPLENKRGFSQNGLTAAENGACQSLVQTILDRLDRQSG